MKCTNLSFWLQNDNYYKQRDFDFSLFFAKYNRTDDNNLLVNSLYTTYLWIFAQIYSYLQGTNNILISKRVVDIGRDSRLQRDMNSFLLLLT